MRDSMTQKVCEHMQAHQPKQIIGDLYALDKEGKTQLFKSGQHFTKRNFGKFYWKFDNNMLRCVRIGKHKYLLVN